VPLAEDLNIVSAGLLSEWLLPLKIISTKTKLIYHVSRTGERVFMSDLAALMQKHQLTIESRFVPFSLSRNKNEKYKSLNWVVKLKKDGREILETDYSAGQGFCPSYKKKSGSQHIQNMVDRECESGKEDTGSSWKMGKQILPDPVNVLSCLLSECDVLNYGGFEQWAMDFGYDIDSRSAYAAYEQCLKTALKLSSYFSHKEMEELKEAGRKL
jgi:hypothetical protein